MQKKLETKEERVKEDKREEMNKVNGNGRS